VARWAAGSTLTVVSDLFDPGVLEDATIELRRWDNGDVDAVRAARRVDEESALVWIQRQQNRSLSVGVSRAIALIGSPAVGYAGLIRRPRLEMGAAGGSEDTDLVFTAHRRVAGIGYWVAPDAQGQGLATRAVALLSRWALTSAGMIRIEALLDPENTASQRVVEKSGFRPEGRLRAYLALEGRPTDAPVYSLLTSDL